MTDSALPRPPETLEGFRIGALRRSAGALAVHAATDRLDLPVEMHIVRTAALPAAFGPDAFTAALRRAAEVRHESLLPYITGGRAGDLLFAAAKSADAPALDEVIARGGKLPEVRVLEIGAAVAGVLAALERSGLRHADLTPRRILLPARGPVAVLPPRLLPPEVSPRNERYLSPEEARGGAGDIRSDLFVLGLLLAEAALGAPLVKGSAADVKRAIASGGARFDGAGLGPAATAAIQTLLAADPAQRFPKAAAAEAALLHAGDSEAHDVAPIARPVPRIVPIDDLPPETAPISLGPVSVAPIPVPAPVSPRGFEPAPVSVEVAPIAAVDASDPAAVRRPPGRLYLTGRLGDAMLEIDESVHVGWPADAIDVAARPDVFSGAEFFVERTEAGDVLKTSSPVKVNGSAVASRVLEHGDEIEGAKTHARYERSARTALKATGFTGGPPPNPMPARMVLLAAMVVALAGIAVSLPHFVGARRAKEEADDAAVLAEKARDVARRDAAPPTQTPEGAGGPAADRELAAREAFDAAKDWARTNPADAAGARLRLKTVADKFGDTGHGAVARAEVADAERRARAGGELDKLLETARAGASDGRLEEAVRQLRDWAEAHQGTVAGERAAAASIQLEAEVTGRLEADTLKVERAIAAKEWEAAFRVLHGMFDYVPKSMKPKVTELRRRAEDGRDGVAKEPPKPTAGPDAPPKPPVTPPEGPPKPPDGPPKPPDAPPTAPPTAPPAAGDREEGAKAALKAAAQLMESGKDTEAIDALLAFMRDWKDTKYEASHDMEARNRLTTLTQGPAGVIKLFKGKVEKAEKGRFRISYDFQDAKQIEDFRDVEAFEAPPRATWKVVDGWVRSKGSGALVLDAPFLPEQIVASTTANPERAHDLGVIFMDSVEPKRFYLYMLQNTFFKLGRGAGVKAFEENTIVLFGPDMWRDTPPGQLGFVRKCGNPEPAVVPGTSMPMKCGRSEGTVWMRLQETKNMSGSAFGDVTPKEFFPRIEPGLFVLNSSGAFDDFVVEGTPDPDWVQQRWRDILSGL